METPAAMHRTIMGPLRSPARGFVRVVDQAYVCAAPCAGRQSPLNQPRQLDLKKDSGLTVEWADGRRSFYPIGYLRRMSPSAEMRQLREEMERNPLTVLPAKMGAHKGPLT